MATIDGDEGRGLLAEQRRAAIAAQVRSAGGVRVTELVARFAVSDMTIRRDLDVLAREGLVDKVHGGAVALSAGTTTYALARKLTEVPELTVVTNSIRIAELFASRQQQGGHRASPTVVLTGGLRTPSDALVGPVADAAIRSLNFDLAFVGCHGISAQAGLSTPNLAEAETNRAMIAAARQVVAVADHSKWAVRGLSTFAPLSVLDRWITDAGLSEEARAEAAEQIRELILA